MILYRIGPNGYYEGSLEYIYQPGGGIPYGTTETAPPDLSDGTYAIWNGSGWTLTSVPPGPPPPPPIPDVQVVSMRQTRRVLFDYGLLSSVEDYINTLESPQREISQIDWEYAIEVRKDSDLVKQISQHLSLTADDINRMFYEASLIN